YLGAASSSAPLGRGGRRTRTGRGRCDLHARAAGACRTSGENGRGRQIRAVAVLPFVNVSKDPDAEYLSDGIPGSIKQDLQEVRSLEVRQLSARSPDFKGADTDLQEVARKLRVQAVLWGKVLQRQDRLSVSIELVDARDQSVLLSGQFEGRSAGLQEKLTEITKQICTKLRLQLTGAEEQRLARREASN